MEFDGGLSRGLAVAVGLSGSVVILNFGFLVAEACGDYERMIAVGVVVVGVVGVVVVVVATIDSQSHSPPKNGLVPSGATISTIKELSCWRLSFHK